MAVEVRPHILRTGDFGMCTDCDVRVMEARAGLAVAGTVEELVVVERLAMLGILEEPECLEGVRVRRRHLGRDGCAFSAGSKRFGITLPVDLTKS
ncbi:hypothetical protein AB0K18_40285 [Nonomuraea sp. NPDC049421]|uniref:hypothetical protein n=1 Tax=Nonomuraea sp. NPDC049421 TaxID=3155275 RepID=UPI0034285078